MDGNMTINNIDPVSTVDDRYYCTNLNDVAMRIAEWRLRKGFDTSWDNLPMKLMLTVSELGEAMEGYRKNDVENVHEEIADTMIRLLDICGSLNIDIAGEINNKMAKNEGRPYRHGKNC